MSLEDFWVSIPTQTQSGRIPSRIKGARSNAVFVPIHRGSLNYEVISQFLQLLQGVTAGIIDG